MHHPTLVPLDDAVDTHAEPIRRWSVQSLRGPGVEVAAPNWLVALGLALHEQGACDELLARAACERLPNGTVVVNDLARRERYAVTPLAEPCAAEDAPATGRAAPYLDWMLEPGAWCHYSQDPLTSIH